MALKIHAKAPIRVDLAGGTLDLWPLYLFLKEPTTLNVGIDLFAEATVTETPVSKKNPALIRLISEDQKVELQAQWSELDQLQAPGALKLHVELLKYYRRQLPEKNLEIKTLARSPAGAGLGGSSGLLVALIGALSSYAKKGKKIDVEKLGESMIEIGRDIETRVIEVPGGLQDYYGAMYGGLQCLRWGVGGHKHDRMDVKLLAQLEKRLLLFYSGQSRNSGINNWALFKSFIDRDAGVVSKFSGIALATQHLETALRRGDWGAVVEAVSSEWNIRKSLAPGISTPEIDSFLAKIQKKSSVPMATKICGAGGGGCFFVLLRDPDPELRKAMVSEAESSSRSGLAIRHLPVRLVPKGLQIKVTRG